MRTKSPAVVQKWVETLPYENITGIPDDTIDESDSLENSNQSEGNLSKFCEENCHTSTTKPNANDIIERFDELDVCHGENTHSESVQYETQTEQEPLDDQHQSDSIDRTSVDSAHSERKFWHQGPLLLTALRIRSNAELNRCTETEDLNASPQLPHSDESEKSTASNQPLLNKNKLNEFYYKLSINKKRYNFIKERKMEAKKLLNNAKSRFLAAANWDETKANENEHGLEHDVEHEVEQETAADEVHSDSNLMSLVPVATTTASEPEASGTTSVVCDTIDMDLSADEFSRLSQSNDMLSVDDEDSFNVSMLSISDSHTTHLNVSRRIAMADIGRSTSDNPRLRNKFYLADIGRSFSEHQDDEAIIIGERNISAPSSSIAIQNNNRSNGNFFERRAYSVSPTQRGLKRGILSRDHSLSDSSRHRNQLSKGSSFQSDSSHCSSVESLLDARKPDSEAILRQLGFGPAHQEDLLSRIPKRYV